MADLTIKEIYIKATTVQMVAGTLESGSTDYKAGLILSLKDNGKWDSYDSTDADKDTINGILVDEKGVLSEDDITLVILKADILKDNVVFANSTDDNIDNRYKALIEAGLIPREIGA
jgi:hypothetical protein